MTLINDFLGAVEVHSPEEIAEAFAAGLDPNGEIEGRTPVEWQLEMYTRSPRFSDCLRTIVGAGARFENDLLLAVLLDDADQVRVLVESSPARIQETVSLRCAFTPLTGASLLHVAAEYGRREAARELLDLGADLEATAAVDENGWGGHTPVFHTVNSHQNHLRPLLRFFFEHGANPDVRLAGLVWGQGFEWETPLFDVTLLSYTQAGLLPQFHRDEKDTYDNLRLICLASKRDHPPTTNVPNQYLSGKRKPR